MFCIQRKSPVHNFVVILNFQRLLNALFRHLCQHLQSNTSQFISSHATIHTYNLSCHPSAIITSQESNHVCNLLGRSDAIVRVEASNSLQNLFTLALEEELCACWTRCYCIDRDSTTCQVLAQNSRHLFNGPFGGVVE